VIQLAPMPLQNVMFYLFLSTCIVHRLEYVFVPQTVMSADKKVYCSLLHTRHASMSHYK